MPLHLPTLLTRTGSAIVFGALMLGALLGPVWAFGLVFLLVHMLAMKEYFGLVAGFSAPVDLGLQGAAQLFGGVLIIAAIFIASSFRYATNFSLSAGLTVILYPVGILLGSSLSAKRHFIEGMFTLGGNLYVTLPLVLLFILRLAGGQDFNLPLLLIVLIWCNDSFAYLSGSLFGKTQMTSISPKKTWEGTAGGALLTVAAAVAFSYFWGIYPFWLTIGFALCAAIPGTLGDLLESKLKRLAGVKDSGNLMPGHGGALDRFDSLLVAAPFAMAYFCAHEILLR